MLRFAQMSSRYEEFVAAGTQRWLQQRIELIEEYKDNLDTLPAPFNLAVLPYDVFKATREAIRWVWNGFKLGLEVDTMRGFKLAIGGRTAEHVHQLACDARDSYLAERKAAVEETTDARINRLQASNDQLTRQVELLQVQIARQSASHVSADSIERAVRNGLKQRSSKQRPPAGWGGEPRQDGVVRGKRMAPTLPSLKVDRERAPS